MKFDINGSLPVILCIVDGSDPNLLKSSYYYADAQILARREHTDPNDPEVFDSYWYVHDRLGSVRMVVEYDGTNEVVKTANSYTYTPFGQFYNAADESVANPFKFTGQWYDEEIDQYHLRARMYDPIMMRFTGRDPVRGDRNEPLTLHKYLYCVNDPVNRIDPTGKISAAAARIAGTVTTGYSFYYHGVGLAAYSVATGDERFWKLANLTFDFMPYAMALALADPMNPVSNVVTYCAEGLTETFLGSRTGFTWAGAAAIDVIA